MSTTDVNKNDWFIASVTSPNKTMGDFSQEGLNPTNTQLLDKSAYQKSTQVQEMFKSQKTGQFDQKQFDTYYDTVAQTYNQFAKDEYSKTLLEDDYYSPLNIYTTKPVKRLQQSFSFGSRKNPNGEVHGILGFTEASTSDRSSRELAQTQNIFNTKTGQFEKYTPNDRGFFKTLFGETAVLATYDTDGVHNDPDSGKQVGHKKGERKTNSEGKFFYETLNEREVYGKEVLSPWDVITVDGSYANKFDFMDSDDKRKSLLGTLMKTAVFATPYIIPQTRVLFGGLAAANTLFTSILPAFTKASMGAVINEAANDSSFYKLMNVMEAKGKTFSGSSSDYAKDNMVSLENIVGTAADVFSQLAQQKFVANVPNIIGQTRKEVEVLKLLKAKNPNFDVLKLKNELTSLTRPERSALLRKNFEGEEAIHNILNKWDKWSGKYGMELGQLYMTAMSSTGVVEAAKANGLDGKDTAMLLLGTTAGLHQLMKSDIGSWALKGMGIDEVGNFVRQTVKNEAAGFKPVFDKAISGFGKGVVKEAGELVETAGSNAVKKASMASWLEKGKSIGKSIANSLNNTASLPAKMAAEGLEEMSEEAIQDGFQQAYNLFRAIGWTSTDESKTQAFSMDNFLQRYTLAFAGGMIGGGLYAIPGLGAGVHSALPPEMSQDLVSIYLHGYGDQYEQELDKAYKKGDILGSTVLSTVPQDVTFNLDPTQKNYKPLSALEDGAGISQNEAVYKMLKNQIKFVKDSIFQEEDLSSAQLLKLYKYRNSELLNFEYTTPLKNDIEKITNQIVNAKAQIESISGGMKDATVEESKQKASELKPLEDKLKGLREELKMIVNGEKYDYYLRHALFAVQPDLVSKYGIKSKEDIALSMYGKPTELLTAEQNTVVNDEFETYNTLSKNDKLQKAVAEHELYMDSYDPHLEAVNSYADKLIADTETAHLVFDQYKNLEDLNANLDTTVNQDGQSVAMGATQARTPEVGGLQGVLQNLTEAEYSDSNYNRVIKNFLEKQVTQPSIGYTNGILRDEAGLEVFDEAGNPVFDGDYSRTATNFSSDYLAETLVRSDTQVTTEDGEVISINNNLFSENSFSMLMANLGISDALKFNNLWELSNNIKKIEEAISKVDETLDDMLEKDTDFVEAFEDSEYSDNVPLEEINRMKAEVFNQVKDKTVDLLKSLLHSARGGQALYQHNTNNFVLLPGSQNTVELHDFAEQARNVIENNTKLNPIFEIAKDMSAKAGQNKAIDLLDLLGKEYTNLANSNRVDDYLIQNPMDEADLMFMKNILGKAQAVLHSATDYRNAMSENEIIGYNSAVNAAMSKGSMTGENKPRTVIDIMKSYTIDKELQAVTDRIDLLLSINRHNKNGSIREMRAVGIRMATLYANVFDNESEGYSILTKAGVDLTKLNMALANTPTLTKVTSILNSLREGDTSAIMPNDQETFIKIREEVNTIEQAIYETVNVDSDAKALIPKIIDNLPVIDPLARPLDISSGTLHLDAKQIAMYVGKTISVDPKQFYRDFAGDLSQPTNALTESKYAPFYGQELALGFGYWSMLSSKRDIDTYKMVVNKILPNNAATEAEVDPLFKGNEAFHSIKNAMSIFGIPGAGKSTAVSSVLFRIAKSYGLNVTAYAPHESQSENLKALGDSLNTDYKISSLFESILGADLNKEINDTFNNVDKDRIKDPGYLFKLAEAGDDNDIANKGRVRNWLQINPSHPKVAEFLEKDLTILVNGEIPNVILIDEATQVSSPLVQLLDLAVSKHNVKNPNKQVHIIFTGDLEQGGATMKVGSNKILSNMSAFNFLNTPTLSQSLRSNYNLLNNNINRVRALKEVISNAYEQNIPHSVIYDNHITSEVLLDYSESADKLIGYKIQDQLEVADIANMFKHTNAKGEEATVAIITDKGQDYRDNLLKDLTDQHRVNADRIKFVSPEEVQGLEFDYVVIDVNNDRQTLMPGEEEVNVAAQQQYMYTLLSRSRVGSLANSRVTGLFKNIKSNSDNVYPQIVKLDESEIAKYQTFTVQSITNSYNSLKDLPSNITGASKKEVVPTFALSKDEAQEMMKTVLLDSIDNNLTNKYDDKTADNKDVKFNPEETSPLGYTYHIPSIIKSAVVKGNVVIGSEKLKDVTEKQETLHSWESAVTDAGPIYSFYKNDGDSPEETLAKAERIHAKLKNELLNYFMYPKDTELSSYLDRLSADSELQAYLRDSGLLDNIGDFRLGVVTKEFNPEFDKDISNSKGGTTGSEGGLTSYFALISKDTVTKTFKDNTYTMYDRVITLGAFANPSNPIIKNIPGVQDAFTKIHAAHAKYTSNNDLSSKNRSYFIFDGNPSDILKPISNISIKKASTDEHPTYAELKKMHPEFNFSPALIAKENFLNNPSLDVSDKVLDEVGKPLSAENKRTFSLKGRHFALVTTDPTLTTTNDMYDKLIQEIAAARQSPEGSIPGTVKIMILNPAGRKFSDWINHNQDLVKQHALAPENKEFDDLRMATNDYAAAKIFARMIHTHVMRSEAKALNKTIFFENAALSKIPGFNPNNKNGGNPDVFYDQLATVINIITNLTTGEDFEDFTKLAFNTDDLTLSKYFKDSDRSLAISRKTDPKDKGSFNEAREHFLALDILALLKNNDKASDILNESSEIVAKGYNRRLMSTFVGAMRVAVLGGSMNGKRFETLFDKATPEYNNFVQGLDLLITESVGNYKVLFPDGIWPAIFFKNDVSHASGDYVPFYEASGDGSELLAKFKLNPPNVKLDVNKIDFDTVITPVQTSQKAEIEKAKSEASDKALEDLLLNVDNIQDINYVLTLGEFGNLVKDKLGDFKALVIASPNVETVVAKIQSVIDEVKAEHVPIFKSTEELNDEIASVFGQEFTAKYNAAQNYKVDTTNLKLWSRESEAPSFIFQKSNATHTIPVVNDENVVLGTVKYNPFTNEITVVSIADFDNGIKPTETQDVIVDSPEKAAVQELAKQHIDPEVVVQYNLQEAVYVSKEVGEVTPETNNVDSEVSTPTELVMDVLVNGEKKGIFVVDTNTNESEFKPEQSAEISRKVDKKTEFETKLQPIMSKHSDNAVIADFVAKANNFKPEDIENQKVLSAAYLKAKHSLMTNETNPEIVQDFTNAYTELIKNKCK